MKIQLNSDELNQLVLDHINSMGISTENFDVELAYSIDGCSIGLNKKETNKTKPIKKKKVVDVVETEQESATKDDEPTDTQTNKEMVDNHNPFSSHTDDDLKEDDDNPFGSTNEHSLFG